MSHQQQEEEAWEDGNLWSDNFSSISISEIKNFQFYYKIFGGIGTVRSYSVSPVTLLSGILMRHLNMNLSLQIIRKWNLTLFNFKQEHWIVQTEQKTKLNFYSLVKLFRAATKKCNFNY